MNVIRVETDQDLFNIFKLRATVWSAENKIAIKNNKWKYSRDSQGENHWIIPDEPDLLHQSAHFAVKEDGIIIAAAKITIYDAVSQVDELHRQYDQHLLNSIKGRAAYFSRLVVHPDHQGKGISKKLSQVRVDYAAKQNCKYCFASATFKSRNALEKIGFIGLTARKTHIVEPINEAQPVSFMLAEMNKL